ncbi:MAG: T9SS type A sorting domain-containing protein [Putridiphycobacter sp.]|nr:T9SS type A sorting domain-containing protein [Putridiphycobacter sp.]
MKKVLLYIVLSFTTIFNGTSQCFPDRHSTAWYDGWISCEKTENPNETRPESHWILYDFGTVMEMYNLNIWNVNAPKFLSYGIQTAHVDYSLDGVTWEEYGEITLNQGTGENTYEGEAVLNFNGKQAKFLLITANTTYGSACAGLAEIKLEVDSVENQEPQDTSTVITDSVCIVADVYPNPVVTNEIFVTLTQQCVPAVHYTLTDISGRTIVPSSPISLNEQIEILKGRKIPAGVYILELTSNYAKSEYKIVKQ